MIQTDTVIRVKKTFNLTVSGHKKDFIKNKPHIQTDDDRTNRTCDLHIRFLMEVAFITSGLPPAGELRYNSSVITDVRSQWMLHTSQQQADAGDPLRIDWTCRLN